MFKSSVPSVGLNNRQHMPLLGLGTWGSPKGQVAQAVKDAIDIGYCHIDCAHVYENEHEVGEGIAVKIKEGAITRDELFVTSKLWNTFHRPDLVRGACETSLKNLGLSYIDMYLIHWPMAYKEGGELFPTDENGKTLFSDVDYVDTWKEMEKLVADGLCKSIGVSNFNKKQMERIMKTGTIPPATNQIECHPYLAQNGLSDFCDEHNILLTAYSPLGSPNRPWATPDDPVLLEDPKLIAIAEKHKKSPAQILIRYQMSRGHAVIPKSVTKSRIESNINVFDFKLDDDDMEVLQGFDCNRRYVPLTNVAEHEHYPFHDEC